MIHTSAKLMALVEEAEIGDATLSRLLEPFDIGVKDFKDVDGLFTQEQMLALFRVLVVHIGRPDAVFRAGQRFRFTDFGVFGLAIMSQSDLRTAFKFVMRYRPLSSPMIGLDVRDTKDSPCLMFSPLPGTADDADIYPRLLDFNISLFCSLITDAIGREDFVADILLSACADDISGDLLREKGFKVTTGAKIDAVRLKPWAMDAPLRLKSTVGAATAKRLCSEALANMENISRFSAEVQAVIIANVEKPLTAAFVARRLGMGERSLRRRLSQERLSFRSLKQSVQNDIACRYLTETRMTVEEVATAVGYGDVANFRRAFRVLHGVAPNEFRRTQSV